MKAARYPDPPQKVDVIYEDGYRVTDKYVLFYGSFLSNFAKCRFTWEYMGESHEFFCTEQKKATSSSARSRRSCGQRQGCSTTQ